MITIPAQDVPRVTLLLHIANARAGLEVDLVTAALAVLVPHLDLATGLTVFGRVTDGLLAARNASARGDHEGAAEWLASAVDGAWRMIGPPRSAAVTP